MEIFMNLQQAIQERHAVRDYMERPLEAAAVSALEEAVRNCNREGGLHIQLVTNEPDAFGGLMARYGKFSNVRNYIALIGQKGPELDEKIGYYGERLALTAQMLGLNTCWAAMSYSKGKTRCDIGRDEKLVCVLSLGYGKSQGTPHRSKPMEALCVLDGAMPSWFRAGMEAAMLAPTAMNQQKFRFTLSNGKVRAEATGGFYAAMDLGIVKYHFEAAAGPENFQWI